MDTASRQVQTGLGKEPPEVEGNSYLVRRGTTGSISRRISQQPPWELVGRAPPGSGQGSVPEGCCRPSALSQVAQCSLTGEAF